MRRTTRRDVGKTGGILHLLAVLGAAAMAAACAALAVAVFTFHLSMSPVLTGSMRPTFAPGSLIVTSPIAVDRLTPGMIVLFVPPGEHAVFAHRITSVSGPGSAPVITTKGDANSSPDPWHARLTRATVPRVVASVPLVGQLLEGSGPDRLILVVAGGLVAGVVSASWVLRPRRRPVWRATV